MLVALSNGRMRLTLDAVVRLAKEVVHQGIPRTEVVGATTRGGSNYTEIVLTVFGGSGQPSRLVIGTTRDASEQSLRHAVADAIRQRMVGRDEVPDGA